MKDDLENLYRRTLEMVSCNQESCIGVAARGGEGGGEVFERLWYAISSLLMVVLLVGKIKNKLKFSFRNI